MNDQDEQVEKNALACSTTPPDVVVTYIAITINVIMR